jgi:hypothetical protein
MTFRILPTNFQNNTLQYQVSSLTLESAPEDLKAKYGAVLHNPLWAVCEVVWTGRRFPSLELFFPGHRVQIDHGLINPQPYELTNDAGAFVFDGNVMVWDIERQQHMPLGVFFLPDETFDNTIQHHVLLCCFCPTIWRHALFLFQKYFQR